MRLNTEHVVERVMNAQEYYQSLLSQGYSSEAATIHTQQDYPDFVADGSAPQMASSQANASSLPASMEKDTGDITAGTPNTNLGGLVAAESIYKGKKFHIFNGVCGIFLSLFIMGFSYSISSDYETIGASFGISQFNTLGSIWMVVFLIGLALFAISIIQFMDKPYGSKGMLVLTGILLVMLLLTGFQEYSTFEEWDDEAGEESVTYFEANGTFLFFCTAPCFGIFTLFAFLGRDNTPPNMKKTFDNIYSNKLWGENKEGKGNSGSGSLISTTTEYRYLLEQFIKDNDIKSIVDLGCGDWEWMREFDLGDIRYTGIDVSSIVIENNNKLYSTNNIKFINGDANNITEEVDLIVIKDVLQHLPLDIIKDTLNIVKTKCKYSLITNDYSKKCNKNIPIGSWTAIDLTRPPFDIDCSLLYAYNSDGNNKRVMLYEPTKTE